LLRNTDDETKEFEILKNKLQNEIGLKLFTEAFKIIYNNVSNLLKLYRHQMIIIILKLMSLLLNFLVN